MKKESIFVKMHEKGIEVGYTVVFKQEAGMYSAYIKGFDIYFSAPTEDEIDRRGRAIIRTFVDFWLFENSLKDFTVKLHKLGFRTRLHDLAMKNFLNNKKQNANFSAENIISLPDIFNASNTVKRIERKELMAV